MIIRWANACMHIVGRSVELYIDAAAGTAAPQYKHIILQYKVLAHSFCEMMSSQNLVFSQFLSKYDDIRISRYVVILFFSTFHILCSYRLFLSLSLSYSKFWMLYLKFRNHIQQISIWIFFFTVDAATSYLVFLFHLFLSTFYSVSGD